MSNRRKTRSTEEKGDEGKPSESSSTKGHDDQADLQALILGLATRTKKVDSLVTDNMTLHKKMDNIVTEIKRDKITLNKNMDNVVMDANISNAKMDNVVTEVKIFKRDEMDVTAMNRVSDQVLSRVTEKFEDQLKGINPLDEDSTEHADRAN